MPYRTLVGDDVFAAVQELADVRALVNGLLSLLRRKRTRCSATPRESVAIVLSPHIAAVLAVLTPASAVRRPALVVTVADRCR
jgi:hypothetical protein